MNTHIRIVSLLVALFVFASAAPASAGLATSPIGVAGPSDSPLVLKGLASIPLGLKGLVTSPMGAQQTAVVFVPGRTYVFPGAQELADAVFYEFLSDEEADVVQDVSDSHWAEVHVDHRGFLHLVFVPFDFEGNLPEPLTTL